MNLHGLELATPGKRVGARSAAVFLVRERGRGLGWTRRPIDRRPGASRGAAGAFKGFGITKFLRRLLVDPVVRFPFHPGLVLPY